MSIDVDVQVATEGEDIPDVEELATWVKRTVSAVGDDSACEVSLRIVGAEEIRQLNQAYRGKDKPTNVLSFPAAAMDGLPATVLAPLGDIVFCGAVIAAEASQQSKAAADHWAHLVVHGVLHLLGHDHETDSEAAVMEGLEIRILSDHGIANPYAEPVCPS